MARPRDARLPHRRQRAVPPRLLRHPRPGHQPRPAHQRRPTASPPCCASSTRTRSRSTCGISLRPARRPPSATRSTRSTRPHRRQMDDDLAVQLPYVRRVCEVFGLPIIDVAGLRGRRRDRHPGPRRRWSAGYKVVVVSGDKDLLQLVTDDVLVLNPGREGAGVDALRPQDGGGEVRRAAGARGGRAGAGGRLGGQRPRRARASATRARATWSASSARWRRCSTNADKVKRAAYREGLKAHRDDALLSKQPGHPAHRRAGRRSTWRRCARRRPTARRPTRSSRELEFVALAKEFAPEAAPDAAPRTACVDDRGRARARWWRRRARPGRWRSAVVRDVARADARRARSASALAWQAGEAVYVPLAHSPLELPGRCPRREVLDAAASRCSRTRRSRKLSARGKHDRILLARQGARLRGAGLRRAGRRRTC